MERQLVIIYQECIFVCQEQQCVIRRAMLVIIHQEQKCGN